MTPWKDIPEEVRAQAVGLWKEPPPPGAQILWYSVRCNSCGAVWNTIYRFATKQVYDWMGTHQVPAGARCEWSAWIQKNPLDAAAARA